MEGVPSGDELSTASRQGEQTIKVGDIAGWTRHAGCAAPASFVAIPGTVSVLLAHPMGVLTALAFRPGFHFAGTFATSTQALSWGWAGLVFGRGTQDATTWSER
jgi:hypothetical protein